MPPILREEPENGDAGLSPHIPLQLLHLRLDHQINGFVGCDCHIEQGFKVIKRAGWPWQRTRMSDPQRAARRWLAVAVATLWLLSVGGDAEDTIPIGTLPALPATLPLPRQRQAPRRRLVSVFRQGWQSILVALLHPRPLPIGRFVPAPWPNTEMRETNLRVIHELPLAA